MNQHHGIFVRTFNGNLVTATGCEVITSEGLSMVVLITPDAIDQKGYTAVACFGDGRRTHRVPPALLALRDSIIQVILNAGNEGHAADLRIIPHPGDSIILIVDTYPDIPD